MGNNVGVLDVELTFTDKGFTVTTRKAGEVLREFGGTLATVDRAMEKHEQHHVSTARSFRNVMVTVAATRFALMDLNQVVLALPRSVMKAGGEMERLTQLMKGLSKETTEAARSLEASRGVNFVTQMAQRAPFEIKSIADAYVKLKTAGIDPTNGSLQSLIDSVAKFGGTGETLHRASIAIQQMAGKGVISMEELRQQLGEAIPTAMQSMAQGMGMSMAELTKAVSKGTVSAVPALQRMFLIMKMESTGAANEMMKTWTGMTAQMGTVWTLFQKDVFDAGFGEEMKNLAKDFTAAFKDDEVKRFAYTLGKGLSEGVKGLSALAASAKDAWPAIKLLGEVMVTYFAATWVTGFLRSVKTSIDFHRTAAAETAAINVKRVADAHATALAVIAAESKELAQKRTIQNQVLFEAKAFLKQVEAEEVAHNIKMKGIRAAGLMQMPRTGIDANLEAGRQRVFQAQQNVKALAAEATQHTALTGAMNVANAAATTSVVRFTAMRAALAFMGGGIGLAITALAVIIPMWIEFGNRGAEAIKKINDARESGTANAETLQLLDTQMAEKMKQIAALRPGIDTLSALPGAENDQTLKNEKKNLAKLESDLAILSDQRVEIRRQANKNEAAKFARVGEAATADQLTAISLKRNQKINAINIAEKAELENLKSGTAAYIAVQARAVKDRTAADNGGFQSVLANLRAKEARLKIDIAALESPEGRSTSGAAAMLRGVKAELDGMLPSLIQAESDVANAKKTLGNSVDAILAGKATGAPTAGQNELVKLTQWVDELRLKSEGVIGPVAHARAEIIKLLSLKDKKGASQMTPKEGVMANKKVDVAEGLILQVAATDDLGKITDKVNGKLAEFALKEEGVGAFTIKVTKEIFEMKQAFGLLLSAKTIKDLDELAEKMAKLGVFEQGKMAEKLKLYTDTINAETEILTENLGTREARLQAQFDKDIAREQKKLAAAIASGAEQQGAEEAFNKWSLARDTKLAEDKKGPLLVLTKSWEDSAAAMQEATARWADSSIDFIVDFVKTGKANFADFTIAILADILKIQLRAQLSGALNTILSSISTAIGSALGGAPAGPEQLSGPGSGYTPPTPHALGGIMTEFGSMPLKKYSMGGIATSPQMAVFGEGAQNEAYVPLPDGRSIPVTMKGGAQAAPNVVVNVINQTSQEVKASSGQPRFDGQQMILDVVLSAVGRPGTFRDGMKGAMR